VEEPSVGPVLKRGEKKEACTSKNIVYESKCRKCNPPGSRREQDKQGLEERRALASLYVGDTARSLSERAGEHWRDGEAGKEETHMVEHLAMAHVEEDQPEFDFRVVKKCKRSLERQVRESVRIDMRGNVLNKKGVYSRCRLTKLVVDQEWEQKVGEESWAKREITEGDGVDVERGKAKRGNKEPESRKRFKLDTEEGVAWVRKGPLHLITPTRSSYMERMPRPGEW
jgi:hypothetical protein